MSKRNPGKILNRVPVFTADLILTIPTIQMKPQLGDMQQLLNRSIVLITECLKRVVIWGQSRRTSFDNKAADAYYKDVSKLDEAGANPYPRLQPADALCRFLVIFFNIVSFRKYLRIYIFFKKTCELIHIFEI